MISVSRRYHFESAHLLPHVPDGHRCKALHGHNYLLEITVEGPLLNNGFLMDFFDMDAIVAPLLKIVDHHYLNEIDGLDNPTAEIISDWWARRLQPLFEEKSLHLSLVRIYETNDCWADWKA